MRVGGASSWLPSDRSGLRVEGDLDLVIDAGLGQLGRAEQLLVVFAVWLLQLWLAPWWLRRFAFGPLEWAWRALTYWRRPPFRRSEGHP